MTGATSRKAAALRASGRASFLVQSEELPYRYVSVEGPVRLADADLEKHVRPIAHRYLGAEGGDAYLDATREERDQGELIVHLHPERWLTVDYRKQFGAA